MRRTRKADFTPEEWEKIKARKEKWAAANPEKMAAAQAKYRSNRIRTPVLAAEVETRILILRRAGFTAEQIRADLKTSQSVVETVLRRHGMAGHTYVAAVKRAHKRAGRTFIYRGT